MATHNFRELKIWQNSRTLVKDVYLLSDKFPNDERFGLTSQVRRAVVSIAANISEGAGRGTNKDFSRFLDMSEGSANEVLTLLFLSYDLNYIKEMELNALVETIEENIRMINGFRKKLNN